MEPSLVVGGLWLLFGGTHIGLATRRIRAPLVGRLGERGFQTLFSLIAALTFSALVYTFATYRGQGAPGPALFQFEALRWLLVGAIGAGVVLTAGALAAYPGSPMSFSTASVRPPRGIERLSRHSFFAGVALFALAHVLLAPYLVDAVFFAGLALLATVGAHHQDTKLRARFGPPYDEYLRATSFVPFAAVASGRQRVVWGELPWVALVVGLGIAFALRQVHAAIFDYGGAWVIGATLGGAAFATFQEWRHERRQAAPEEQVGQERPTRRSA